MEGNPSKETMLDMYKRMLLIRKFEIKLRDLYVNTTEISGVAHGYVGEEAIAVGVCYALEKDDLVLSTHRGHGHSLAKGVSARALMAELMGKETGVCKGLGGSMHSSEPEVGLVFSTAIVGGNIPISTGVGLGIKLKGEKRVAVSFFGDGAVNTGAFHEGVNLAALWKLPVIFICENNQYAVSMPITKSCAAKNVVDRAIAYNIPGKVVDGNDVLEVYNTVLEAKERAIRGEGPSFLECRTYRWFDHGMYFIGKYRSEEEIEEWKKKDPIKRLKEKLTEISVREEEFERIEKEVDDEIEDCVDFARKSKYLSFEAAMNLVYAK